MDDPISSDKVITSLDDFQDMESATNYGFPGPQAPEPMLDNEPINPAIDEPITATLTREVESTAFTSHHPSSIEHELADDGNTIAHEFNFSEQIEWPKTNVEAAFEGQKSSEFNKDGTNFNETDQQQIDRVSSPLVAPLTNDIPEKQSGTEMDYSKVADHHETQHTSMILTI